VSPNEDLEATAMLGTDRNQGDTATDDSDTVLFVLLILFCDRICSNISSAFTFRQWTMWKKTN